MTNYLVGQPVQYIDSKGRAKAAIILATHDSIEEPKLDENGEPVDGSAVRPLEGHVHVAIFGLSDPFHTQPRVNVPTREVAESIPDYTVEGVLVGFVQAVGVTTAV